VSLKGGVDLTNATRSITDGNPNPNTESMVEEALDEIEALDKQQDALKMAREAFDKAITASQEAKEQAKKLAEEVSLGRRTLRTRMGTTW
jgi:type II secretory pathway component PulF